MVWFKVDDGFAFHPKTLAATNAALGLWVRAGAWSGANLTDGALPEALIATLGGQKRDTDRLVRAGLWVPTDVGFHFVDWDQWQPSKEQVRADQEATRARVASWRERQRNGVTNGVGNGVSTPAPTRPDPTRPDRSSFGTTRSASATHPRTRTRPKSTGTKRAEDLAAIVDEIEAERAANNGAPKQLGT